jgi:hypothetical protein
MRTSRTKLVSFTAATTIVLGALLSSAAVAEEVPPQPTVQEVGRDLAAARAASARYHRVEVALADGFVDTGRCVALPDGSGGMGVHFVNPTRMGDGHLEVTEPEMLLYEEDARGRYRLIGVEYLGTAGDALFGRALTPGPAGHALHVWLWKHNPSGMFADWNPNVTC